MTTGSVILDHSKPHSSSGGWTGSKFSRVWSGADRSPSNHTPSEHSYNASVRYEQSGVIWLHHQSDPPGVWTEYTSSVIGVYQNWPVWDSNDQIRLVNRLKSRVAGHQFNAGIFAAEGRKSLDMISKRATQFYRAYRSLRKGDVRGLRKHLGLRPGRSYSVNDAKKNASNIWLESDFGWKPMLSDVYEAGNAAFALTNRAVSNTYRVQLKKRNPPINGWNQVLTEKEGYYEISKEVRVVLAEDYSPVASLGLTDPLSVTWELIPFSFVVDWFLPLGNYLEARSFRNALRIKSAWETVRQKGEVHSLYMLPVWQVIGAPLITRWVDVNRNVTALSVPPPTIKPLMAVPSWKRAVDAVSLILQRR